MRVLVLSNIYPPEVHGGYELLARDVVEGLAARGHRAVVLTSGTGAETDELVRSLRLARRFGERPTRDRFLHLRTALHNAVATRRFLARRERFDVALAMSQRRLGLAPLRVLRHAGIPVVYTVNDDWPVAYVPQRASSWRRLPGALLDRLPLAAHTWRGLTVERVVYLSESIRRHVQRAGAPLPLGVVCAQGIDTCRFPPRGNRPLGTPLRLLFVGRIHPSKGADVAVATVAELRRRGIAAMLTVVGPVDDPVYGAEVHRLAGRLGLVSPTEIAWQGAVDRERLPLLYQAADMVLYLALWEGEAQGLVYLEAMASGTPVVAFARGGAAELLDCHPSAAMRPTAPTGEAFADAVEALARDGALRSTAVAAGLDLVRRTASLDRYLDALETELAAAAAGCAATR